MFLMGMLRSLAITFGYVVDVLDNFSFCGICNLSCSMALPKLQFVKILPLLLYPYAPRSTAMKLFLVSIRDIKIIENVFL